MRYLAATGAALGATILLASAPNAQTSFTEVCTGRTTCLAGASDCKTDTVRFHFFYDEDAQGNASSFVTMPGSARVFAATEPSTQGYTWSSDTRVYTLIYLFNDAFGAADNPEFLMADADIAGRLDTVILSTGTCEVID